jgi:putative peptidoglycan lipid II flippase
MESIVMPYNFFAGLFRGEFVISFGIEGLALAYSIASITNLLILMYILRRRIGRFSIPDFVLPIIKIFVAAFFTAFALYIPIKLLDQLIFDTTRTVNLIMLTGISSAIGLSLYLFLTWFFNVKEAKTYVQIIGKLGNWRDILRRSDEVIEGPKI